MGPTRERNCALIPAEDERGSCELAFLEPDNSTPIRIDANVVGIYARHVDAGRTPEVGDERTTAPDVRQRNKAAAACASVIQHGDCPLYELLAPRLGAGKCIVEKPKGDTGKGRLHLVC